LGKLSNVIYQAAAHIVVISKAAKAFLWSRSVPPPKSGSRGGRDQIAARARLVLDTKGALRGCAFNGETL
jgi:hypothetical protein